MTDAVIVNQKETSLARVDPQALISQAITAGASIDTMERLVALAKDVRIVQAREAWYAAMAEFQRQCPPIFKERTGKTQNYSYKYASIDDVLGVIQPVMGPLGLSVSWKTRFEPGAAVANCRISHTLGHFEESGEVTIPIEAREDGKGATPAQRVGIAMTYAQRYSLKAAAGVAPTDADDTDGAAPRQEQSDEDGDQRAPGAAAPDAAISEPQVKRLWAIAREQLWSQDDVKDLLTSLGVNHTNEIPRSKYDAVIDKIKATKKPVPTGKPA